LGGEVLLYFIERVEVIEIQIWFEFKLVQNLEMIWKIKKPFSYFPAAVGWNFLSSPTDCLLLTCAQPTNAAQLAWSRGPMAQLIFPTRSPGSPAAAHPKQCRRLRGYVTELARSTLIEKKSAKS
jgi:hypothetical protein